MYKIEIEIGAYNWSTDEKVTIETSDFDKIAIIQEFIEFQKDHGWCVEYDVTDEYNQCDEDDEDDYAFVMGLVEEDEVEAEYDIGDWYYDEDGSVWERIA
jgi:hypothetical protein